MKVLVIGRQKWLHTEAAFYRVLVEQGHEVALVDDRRLRQLGGAWAADQWLRARVRAFRPDRILMAKPLDVSPEVLGEVCARAPSTMWYRDIRIPPDPEIVARASKVDVLFLTPGGQAPEYEALGVKRALYLPDTADPRIEHPAEASPELRCDVAFIGRGYDVPRSEFLCRLAERFDLRVWGQDWGPWAKPLRWNGETAYGRDFARVCASARIVLGADPSFQLEHAVRGYHSNRIFKVLACRGFLLGQHTPGVDDVLRGGEHCAWYRDEADAFAQIERYLSDGAERERIRATGHTFFLEHHTIDHRMHNLLTGEPWRNPLEA